MSAFAIAKRGKGFIGALKRGYTISQRYGITPAEMGARLRHFSRVLEQFDCGATFPITAVSLERSPHFVDGFRTANIEFALHGYYHYDHQQLSPENLNDQLQKAQKLFRANNLSCHGFRCPYLRWNQETMTALQSNGFLYDSSEGLFWDVAGPYATESYLRVLDFYGAKPASVYPALPRWENGIIRIPYCLPDDESLVDRFQLERAELMQELWQAILAETYRSGELFTLGLHPERILPCEQPLRKVLETARSMAPGVWIARLDEIAAWWKQRAETTVQIDVGAAGELHLVVHGDRQTTLLVRGVSPDGPTAAWRRNYRKAEGLEIRWRMDRRPFIGISPDSCSELRTFLTQQGYIVETASDGSAHTFYLDCPRFVREDERRLLEEIEKGDFPLVRIGRWPDGAVSALCITGDIDALTVWDYGLRFLGR